VFAGNDWVGARSGAPCREAGVHICCSRYRERTFVRVRLTQSDGVMSVYTVVCDRPRRRDRGRGPRVRVVAQGRDAGKKHQTRRRELFENGRSGPRFLLTRMVERHCAVAVASFAFLFAFFFCVPTHCSRTPKVGTTDFAAPRGAGHAVAGACPAVGRSGKHELSYRPGHGNKAIAACLTGLLSPKHKYTTPSCDHTTGLRICLRIAAYSATSHAT